MSMDRDTAIRKAKAALRRAVDDSTTPAEREIALRQAKALLSQHDADEIDVIASEIVETSMRIDGGLRPPAWKSILLTGVAKAFGCRVFRSISHFEGAKVVFVGFAPWSEIAAYSFEQLLRQGKRDRKAFYESLNKRRKKKTRTAEANAYAEGWAESVYAKILRPMMDGRPQSEDDQAALDRHMERHDLSPAKAAKRHAESDRYWNAANRGHQDGRNAVLRSGAGVDGRARSLTHQGG